MSIPPSIIQEVNDKIDPLEVIGGYLTLTRQGTSYLGLCPFHQEKTPSFSVDPVRGLYYCFGCHKGGNTINFLMEIEKLTFPEAIRRLARRYNVTIPETGDPEVVRDQQILTELYASLTNSFSYLLKQTPAGQRACRYLETRQISREIIDEFKLGWAPDKSLWLFNFLTRKRYSIDYLAKTGLFSARHPRRSLFVERLIFPVFSPTGRIVGFGGRALKDGRSPKYLNTPETAVFKKKRLLYGLYQSLPEIRKKGCFILVEGYTDVLAFFQAGCRIAVAPLGTSFTVEQAAGLARYSRKGEIIFDGDQAGQRAAAKAVRQCEAAGIEVSVIALPDGLDPDDFIKKEGLAALQKLRKSAISGFDFLMTQESGSSRPRTASEKELLIAQLAPVFLSTESLVRREEYIKKLADYLDLSYQTVLSAAQKGQQAGPGKNLLRNTHNFDEKQTIDLFLMLSVAAKMDTFDYVRKNVALVDLADPRASELYMALEEGFRQGDGSQAGLLSRIESESLKNLVAQKLARKEFSVNHDRLVGDGVNEIKKRALSRRQRQVERCLRRENLSANDVRDLLAEKMYFDQELEKLKVGKSD